MFPMTSSWAKMTTWSNRLLDFCWFLFRTDKQENMLQDYCSCWFHLCITSVSKVYLHSGVTLNCTICLSAFSWRITRIVCTDASLQNTACWMLLMRLIGTFVRKTWKVNNTLDHFEVYCSLFVSRCYRLTWKD